jgi:sulfur carrier protein
MKLIVNGTATEHRDDATVADVVSQLTVTPSGVAVAVNGVVVAHSAWTTTPLTDNDSVEVLTAVQGG